MIGLRSGPVSEGTCPAEGLEAFHNDLIGPAYFSFTLLATMFCKSRRPFFLMEMQWHSKMHTHAIQSSTKGLAEPRQKKAELNSNNTSSHQATTIYTTLGCEHCSRSVMSRWNYLSVNALITENTQTLCTFIEVVQTQIKTHAYNIVSIYTQSNKEKLLWSITTLESH